MARTESFRNSSHFLLIILASLCRIVEGQSSQLFTPTATAPSFLLTNEPAAELFTMIPYAAQPSNAPFPKVGSTTRDFTPEGLEKLWDIVGSVQPPPFTTTVEPKTPIALPSPPPPLYPTWYAPQPKDIMSNLSFPPGFKFGVSTAAYQVEGAAKSEGKGPTHWDWAGRQPGVILDGSNGDITDLHYFLYKDDIARIAALGVTAQSFSISWARIYPFAVKGSPLNQEGLDHYSDVINFSLSQGIEPVVTLFHWDLPLAPALYYGGFTSSEIIDDFVNYAVTLFKAFNGRVKTWITFNEPDVFCPDYGGYPFNTTIAPGLNSTTAPYVCAKNLLLAHAKAVQQFRALNISGEIGLKNSGATNAPWRANVSDDAIAAERGIAFSLGIYSDPIYNTGDWPQVVKDTLPSSILPPLTEEEQKLIRGTADYYAIDAYAVGYTAAPPNGLAACIANSSDPNWPSCAVGPQYYPDGWALGLAADPGSPWLIAVPSTLRYGLQQINKRWPSKKIYISEFGFTEPFENDRHVLYEITQDSGRTNYYMTYLGEALLAIHEDGIPLAGTFCWAMIDNAEWGEGLSDRFGIQYVNYSSPMLERTYKRSAMALSEFFGAHLSK